MSDEIQVEKIPKRPSARPLYREFEGDSDLLGIYCVILAEVAWGEYIVSQRKKHPIIAGEYITTMNKLSKLLGKDHRRVRRELNVLVEMGAAKKTWSPTLLTPLRPCLNIENNSQKTKKPRANNSRLLLTSLIKEQWRSL